ncbi:Neuroligin-2 [Portunus trituberculatus]|uniref:Neuroligin-2 n=1 Tax=Portunus trituberculatus TaxID=210409 RepID=A0A5B7IHQ8_PORTR|nr:Neuroligin-2 [Portunus trituberculatus]
MQQVRASPLAMAGAVVAAAALLAATETRSPTPIINTKYGQLRGFYRSVDGYGLRVATYLGVPYATPPVGANRFSPTRTLSQWVGVHEAVTFGPACPQRLPNISNETAALTRMSRGRLRALQRYLPALKRQSEDCLYLNLYVPNEGRTSTQVKILLNIHR